MIGSCTHCAQLEAWRSQRARLRVEEAASDRFVQGVARLRHGFAATSIGRGGQARALLRLMETPGHLVSTETLLCAVARGEPHEVEEQLVKVHISVLRKALRGLGIGAAITTVWGRGYLLEVGAVEPIKAAFPGLFE